MRVMLRAHLDTAAGNEGIKSGALPQSMKKLMDKLKPEAAYFGLHEGVRSCWIVFDLQDSSMMPPLMEELFLNFNADIEVAPVMDAAGLAKGLAAMESSPG
ncbi:MULTISPECIES: hypothetical protein [unclassified Streptomyces]|uniref:hypothetical protein n=1 Tax=unclassified Streptomyces TaxID=2593676 RepID=UPI001BEBDBF7|nr:MULTISPECIES: hypothetical protein [unclassified Streptomyces]MBT2402603.1 hypothetical protein [Streptomyces sp. ISL-21]MBT2457203.1 hypothetical protein [Streptomyces sp. ISL-86]MBT2607996.1 hypothetical protein [Streptomyces sp. ISL-87]